MIPIPKFRFKVEFDVEPGQAVRIGFTEIAGLDVETEVIEYREGTDMSKYKRQILGLNKVNRVTMKRGMLESDLDFFTLWSKSANVSTTTDAQRLVKIMLMNESNQTIVTWTLTNAMMVKMQSTDMKADGNEIAIESAEWVHEGIVLS